MSLLDKTDWNRYLWQRLHMKQIITVCVVMVISASAASRDFHEPLPVLDPLQVKTGEMFLLAPSAYADMQYTNHLFLQSDYSVSDLHNLCCFTLFNVGDIVSVNLYYSTYTLISPFLEGDPVVNVARWWMNAIEMEYGLTAGVNILGYHVVSEYARTSQHPLRAKEFSEVSTDALRVGVVFPTVESANLNLNFYIRGGIIDLFDFWESILPKPKSVGVFSGFFSLQYRFSDFIESFVRFTYDLNFLRAGGSDAAVYCEGGVVIGELPAAIELFLEFLYCDDTEVARQGPSPESLLGVGVRFVSSYQKINGAVDGGRS